MSTTCNFSSICVNLDCNFQHILTLRERRLVRKLYDTLNPNKNEENMQFRRANCSFGQLCNNKECNYKHRLSFQDRKRLFDKYQNSDKNITSNISIPKKNSAPAKKYNLFSALEVEQEPITKKIVNSDPNYFRWEDEADEPFYMQF